MNLVELEKLRDKRKATIQLQLEAVVEAICREVELEGVFPIITITTSPEGVYGGYPRRVRAHASVDFKIPNVDITPYIRKG